MPVDASWMPEYREPQAVEDTHMEPEPYKRPETAQEKHMRLRREKRAARKLRNERAKQNI